MADATFGTWLPIDSNLTPEGAFTALSYLPRAAELKPKLLPPSVKPFGALWMNGESYSSELATKLGVAGVVDLASTRKVQSYVWDVALYSQHEEPTPNGGLIYGTRWGAGLRVRVNFSSYEFSAGVKLSAVAAAASLGLVQASYEVRGFGLSDWKLLGYLPDPGRFDEKTYAQVLGAARRVRDEYLTPKKGLTPVPFMVSVAPGAFHGTPFERARSFLFAARSIVWKNDLKTALSRAEMSMDPIIIRSVYAGFLPGVPDDHSPGEQASAKAREWLAHAGIKA